MNFLVKRKYLLITIICFLIGRELLPFDVSYYKLNSHTSMSSNLSYNKTSLTLPAELQKYNQGYMNLDAMQDIEVYVEGIDEWDISSLESNQYFAVSAPYDISFGLGRFIPFYKSFSYDASTSVNFSQTVTKNGRQHRIRMSGNVSINGSATIYGICSVKKASSLIESDIQGQIRKEIIAKLNEILTQLEE